MLLLVFMLTLVLMMMLTIMLRLMPEIELLMSKQGGQLESRSWGVEGASGQSQIQQKDLSMTRVRCPQHMSAEQLEEAFVKFSMQRLPKFVALAAQSHDSAEASAPPYATQRNGTHEPTLRQTAASMPTQPDLHTSATEGAASGMPPPAYATQMDGPNDMFDAPAAAAAAGGMDVPSRAAGADFARHGLQQKCGKHHRSASQELPIEAPAKKAKPGKLQLLHVGMEAAPSMHAMITSQQVCKHDSDASCSCIHEHSHDKLVNGSSLQCSPFCVLPLMHRISSLLCSHTTKK